MSISNLRWGSRKSEQNSSNDVANTNNDYSIQEKMKNRNSWLFVFAGIMFTILMFAVIFYKFIINDESPDIDTATILTTLLAFFSIYLSATFYFKATEQSNDFYDRSYTHNRSISESLIAMRGNIDGSFKLLEENNKQINEKVDKMSRLYKETEEEKEVAEEKLEETKEEFLSKYSISEDDFEKIIKEVEDLSKITTQLKELKKQTVLHETKNNIDDSPQGVRGRIARHYIRRIQKDDPEILERISKSTTEFIQENFLTFYETSSKSFKRDAVWSGFCNEEGVLSTKGLICIQKEFND